MTRGMWVVLGLLLVSNAAWFVHAQGETPAADPDAAALTERVAQLEAQLAEARAAREEGPELASSQARPVQAKPGRKVRTVESSGDPKPTAAADAKRRVESMKADVLQIEDPGRREAGLVAIGRAIADRDPALAAAALRSLHGLRDATYDKSRFRRAVRARLDDADTGVRAAAAYALLQVEAEDGDLERVLDIVEAHPEDTGQLIVAAWLSKNRVEGRLADLYVKALGAADERHGKGISNQLRGMWVAQEVEDAVLGVFAKRSSDSLWWHILGQIRPTRPARVRVIFEALAKDDSGPPQLLNRALAAHNLEPEAALLAADLAAEGLPSAPNHLARELMLQVLREHGGPRHVAALEAYAANDMVAEALRKEAAQVAEAAARRR